MATLRQYKRDERRNLRDLVQRMNRLHASMGGKGNRPERQALVRCMNILQKEIDREVAPAPTPPVWCNHEDPDWKRRYDRLQQLKGMELSPVAAEEVEQLELTYFTTCLCPKCSAATS